MALKDRDTMLRDAFERAAQRERALHRYPGDRGPQKLAQAMWEDFLINPAARELSGRDLAKKYNGTIRIDDNDESSPMISVSYRVAIEIRDWVFGCTAFPAELVSENWLKRQRKKAEKERAERLLLEAKKSINTA